MQNNSLPGPCSRLHFGYMLPDLHKVEPGRMRCILLLLHRNYPSPHLLLPLLPGPGPHNIRLDPGRHSHFLNRLQHLRKVKSGRVRYISQQRHRTPLMHFLQFVWPGFLNHCKNLDYHNILLQDQSTARLLNSIHLLHRIARPHNTHPRVQPIPSPGRNSHRPSPGNR